MHNIKIISSSIRTGRNSHRVALFFRQYLEQNYLAEAEILDLKEYDFPLFSERLKYLNSPPANAVDFAEKVRNADGVIIVTPEYNSSYPAALKNVIDLLTDEWYHKPVAISTVSSGNFGGMQAIISLEFILWKMRALVAPAMLPFPNVINSFDNAGNTLNISEFEPRLKTFLAELFWCIDTVKK